MNLIWMLVTTSLCAVADGVKQPSGEKAAGVRPHGSRHVYRGSRYGGLMQPWNIARQQFQHQKQRVKRRLLVPTALLPEVLPRAMHWLKTGQGDLGFLANYAVVASRKLKRRQMDGTPKATIKQNGADEKEKRLRDKLELIRLGRRFLDISRLTKNYNTSTARKMPLYKPRRAGSNPYDPKDGFRTNYGYRNLAQKNGFSYSSFGQGFSGLDRVGRNGYRPSLSHPPRYRPRYGYGPGYSYEPFFAFPPSYGFQKFGQRFFGVGRFGYGQRKYRLGPSLSNQSRYRPAENRPGFGSNYQYLQPRYDSTPSYRLRIQSLPPYRHPGQKSGSKISALK